MLCRRHWKGYPFKTGRRNSTLGQEGKIAGMPTATTWRAAQSLIPGWKEARLESSISSSYGITSTGWFPPPAPSKRHLYRWDSLPGAWYTLHSFKATFRSYLRFPFNATRARCLNSQAQQPRQRICTVCLHAKAGCSYWGSPHERLLFRTPSYQLLKGVMIWNHKRRFNLFDACCK